MIDHPDPSALAARLLCDDDIEPGALTVGRADVERLVVRAFGIGVSVVLAEVAGDRCCRICGCTQHRACEGGCSWVGDDDLCSVCAPYVTTRLERPS